MVISAREVWSVTADDGCRIAYAIEGDPSAPVLMLSNSLGTNMNMWAPQVPAFIDAGFRVLRYDSRGHGASDAPAGAYSMDRLGRDAVGLLDTLGIEKAYFCGLSKGGMVGQWLGYRAPERVHCVVLANTSAYMGPVSAWQSRIETIRSSGMAAIADAVILRWFTPEFIASNPEWANTIRTQLLATDVEGYAGCCAAIRDMDLRPIRPLITVPALVIGGSRDPAAPPEASEALAATIPCNDLLMLETAHLSNIELPPAFTEAVIGFLQSVRTKAKTDRIQG
jgi:3-oxoadipate enol-lactonase